MLAQELGAIDMTQRLDYAKASPEGFRAMLALETHCRSAVDHAVLHLVKLRASQINGCAFCIDMHWKEARAAGEPEHRLYGLASWRESSVYSERERAALAWTECLTLIASTHAPDAEYSSARAQFDDKALADLTWAIAAINSWNRVAIAFRAEPIPPRQH
jgi:AhpD family alkylhydroperoxidase